MDKYPLTIAFNTMVNVTIDESDVVMTYQNNRAKIDSKNLDSVSFHEHCQYDLTRGGLLMRFLAVTTILGISASVFLGFSSPYLYGVFIAIIIIDFLFVLFHMMDSFLELKIMQGWIEKYGSKRYYIVEIGNKNGNNIQFIANLDERNKITYLEEVVTQYKKDVSISQSTSQQQEIKKSDSNLDELKKLGELYKLGIIDENEFQTKKKELLK